MTSDETRAMLRDLATTYPHLQDYITGLPDPEATLREWCKILAPVRADFAASAVRRIKNGATPMPTSRWDLSVFPNLIRSLCSRMADEESKAKRAESVKEHSSERAHARQPKPWTNFGEYWRIALAAGSCKGDGRITAERNAEIMKHASWMHLNRPSEHIEVPEDIAAEYQSPTGGVFKKP